MDYQSKLNQEVVSLPKSGIREFFELVNNSSDIISLGVGEPDCPAPWDVREAAIYSLERGETSYTSNLGLLELRKAISHYVEEEADIAYRAEDEIIITVGVSEAFDLALRALVNEGDEVIYHEPCYVSYSPSIVMAKGVPVGIQTKIEDEFELTPEALEAVITPKSKILILNFPTNPTGAVLSKESLEGIAKLAIKHDLIVFTDEIYRELYYSEEQADGSIEPLLSIASLEDMKERTIFLHGFSKAFAMTGFRLGFACAPAPITDAMMKIHQYSMLCAPIMSQRAAIEALKGGRKLIAPMKQRYSSRRNFMVQAFHDMGLECVLPEGAFYAFPKVSSTGLTGKEFALKFLEEYRVAVVPGEAFGEAGQDYIRCCYAESMDVIKEALDRMKQFVEKLHS